MSNFHGVIVYEILEGGSVLNGVYTNTNTAKTPLGRELSNEIAIKKTGEKEGIEGKYDSRYIETEPDPNIVTHCTLEIVKKGPIYEFVWRDAKNKAFYRGLGIKAVDNRIAVSYSNA